MVPNALRSHTLQSQTAASSPTPTPPGMAADRSEYLEGVGCLPRVRHPSPVGSACASSVLSKRSPQTLYAFHSPLRTAAADPIRRIGVDVTRQRTLFGDANTWRWTHRDTCTMRGSPLWPGASNCISSARKTTGPNSKRGSKWVASAIHGDVRRGSGIPNNERYVGRITWCARAGSVVPPGAVVRKA